MRALLLGWRRRLHAQIERQPLRRRLRLALVHDLVEVIVRSGVIVVAAVEGHAGSGAWGLVMVCDLAVAAESMPSSQRQLPRGAMAVEGGTAYHLPVRLGPQRAAKCLLLGERLTAPAGRRGEPGVQAREPGSATARV